MTLEEDAELRSMAEKERDSLVERLYHHASKTFPKLLIPPSKTAQFSALMELRAGAGGDEASLFLGELLRVYTRIAVSNGLRAQLISFSGTDPIKGTAGGGKDAMLEIKGDGAYDKFRFESGVHRVQRVPATETKGRLHTSTVAVVVSPECFTILIFVTELIFRSCPAQTVLLRLRRQIL
jgi:peptide chain release factor 1